MPNSNKYTPILKWKRAEQRAFLRLENKYKNNMMPLLELVMPTVSLYKKVDKKNVRKTPDELLKEIVEKFYSKKLKEIPEEILKCWGDKPIYLDFTLLYNAEKTTNIKLDGINTIIPASMNLGLNIVPVLNLNDNNEIKEAVRLIQEKYKLGVCLRITSSDLLNKNRVSDINGLNEKIQIFLVDSNLLRKDIDLLIDIKELEKDDGTYLSLFNISQEIENLSEWRNLIFASGSFPQSVTDCKSDELNYIPRIDWGNWLQLNDLKTIQRLPIFADYTMRNPIFKESLQYFNSTASIKYTLDDNYLVMKGRVSKFEDYLINAKLLVEDTGHFYGEGFSWGDHEIEQKSKRFHEWIKNKELKGMGNTEDWIAWEINHHLLVVVNQLAKLT